MTIVPAWSSILMTALAAISGSAPAAEPNAPLR